MKIGDVCVPTATETWSAFSFGPGSAARLNMRCDLIRRHIGDLVYSFSEETYWRKIASSADVYNGQTMILAWRKLFLDESLLNVNARAEKLRGSEFYF